MRMRSLQGLSKRERLISISVVLAVFFVAFLSFIKLIPKPTSNLILISLGVPLAIYLMVSRFRKR